MKSQELPGLRENAIVQHETISQSILDRNPAKAREAMQAHLQTFQRAYTLLGRIVNSNFAMPVSGTGGPSSGQVDTSLVNPVRV